MFFPWVSPHDYCNAFCITNQQLHLRQRKIYELHKNKPKVSAIFTIFQLVRYECGVHSERGNTVLQDPCHLAFRENQFFPQRLEYFLNRQHIPVCKSYPIKVSVLFNCKMNVIYACNCFSHCTRTLSGTEILSILLYSAAILSTETFLLIRELFL